MDYGKMAYIKAEELEARLTSMAVGSDDKVTDLTVKPVYDFYCGDFALTSIRASGSVSVIIRLQLRLDEDADELPVYLKVNGLRSAETLINGSAGEVKDALIVCGIKLSGVAELTLSADNAAMVLLTAQIVVNGDGACLSGNGGDAAADKCGSVWCVVSCEDNCVVGYAFTESSPTLTPVYIGAGKKADVTATDNGFLVSLVDGTGNAFAVFLSTTLSLIRRVFVCGGAAAAAATAYGGGYAFVTVEDGRVAVRLIGEDGAGCSEPSYPDLGDGIKGVGFVKNAATPTLILRYDDKSVLRYADEEECAEESVKLSVSAIINYY